MDDLLQDDGKSRRSLARMLQKMHKEFGKWQKSEQEHDLQALMLKVIDQHPGSEPPVTEARNRIQEEILERGNTPEDIQSILENYLSHLGEEPVKGSASRTAERTTQNTEEAKKMIDEKLKGLPDKFSLPEGSLLGKDAADEWQGHTFMSKAASHLIKSGDELSGEITAHLKSVIEEQGANDILSLFSQEVSASEGIDELTEELQQDGFVEQLNQSDQEWDQSMATAFNDFEKANVDSLSKVQLAKANWALAVRLYKSESRKAWRTYKANIKKSSRDHNAPQKHCNDVYQEVKHYKRSTAISEALLTYEQARAQAISDLATAYGELVKELYDSGTEAAVGEATFIQAEQTANESFWTSVQNALDNPS